MKANLKLIIGLPILALGIYVAPIREDSNLIGKYILGNKFLDNRYFIEETLEGTPFECIKIEPYQFKISRIQKGDLLTLEEITLKNLLGLDLGKTLKVNVQRNPKLYS